ncbi:MAG TPA: gamma-glutamyltransferase [Gammaproteobacteria bacterium]|nr:gamma-glutamyltransferase [Gammaproteobacteria bacterium]
MLYRKYSVLILISLLLAGWQVHAAGVLPERAAVASAHPLASQAGVEVLAHGGNAFDAAVAVSAALGVVEPAGSGLGGGGFFLLRRETDGLRVMIDGREVAPAAAEADMYLDASGNPITRASRDGPLAAGIPGLPAALVHLAENYGRLPLEESLQPAIRYASDGFEAYAGLSNGLGLRGRSMNSAAQAVFLPGGQPPAVGSTFRQTDLADTLTAIAERGFDGFYGGEVAARLVEGARAAAGIWTLDDLSNYRVVEREPLIGTYGGATVISVPPPSSGGAVLINMLNILSGFDLDQADTATRTHLLAEAMRRAYRDRAEYLGDTDFVDVPLERLLHPFYAAGQRMSMRIDRATPRDALPGIYGDGPVGGDQTSHFSVLDVEGNAVAGTQSINFGFGSGYMPPGTGVLLNNEMDDFSMRPGVANGYQLLGADANAIAPGKRMLSSMTPTILVDGDGLGILGTPGGSRIITMVLLAALEWIDGANATAMVAVPRIHHQYFPDRIEYEADALTQDQISWLAAIGHSLARTRGSFGNMHVITWDFGTGSVDAASDPRGAGEPRFHTP